MLFWKRIQQAINKKWYPLSVTIGKPVNTQELANRIARESTVSPADAHAVIRAMPHVMADFMQESRAVHLEGFGWFRYIIKSNGKGVDKKEDVSNKQITGIRVQFTPERERDMGGGYTRSLVSDGISFAEWLGKDEEITDLPGEEGGEEEGGGESPDPIV